MTDVKLNRWRVLESFRRAHRLGTGGLCGAMLALSLAPMPAQAEYHLSAGDILEISAIGLNELRQTATINPDGQAWLPLIGPVKAAGLSLIQLRGKVEEQMRAKIFRRRGENGQEYPVIINPEEITITIAEYRPVYFDGDVARPGAQPYRSGMTIRQGLATAGGYDVMRFRGRDPFLESADFRAEYYSLWIEFAKEQAQIARLKAELGNQSKIDRQGFLDTPIPQRLATEIEERQSEQLKTKSEDRQNEIDHLRRAIAQEDNRIAALTEVQRKEHEGSQVDEKELEEMRANFKKGMIPVSRMSETRRITMFSATQALQTTALLAQAERERETLSRSLQHFEDERRIRLLTELQDAEVRIESVRARLQAVGDKLMYSSMVRSQLARGTGGKLTIKLFRQVNGAQLTLTADEDSELMPGDVVEVSVRMEELTASKN